MSYNVWPSHYHLFVQHVQTVSTYSFWSSSLDRTGLWKCEYKAELAGKTRQSKWRWILTTSQFLLCLWNRQRHRDGQYHRLINQLKISTTGTLDIDGFLWNGALTLLVGWQEGYPACKKLVLAYYYYYYKMYWLEWCCHSITVAGALNNEKKKKKVSPQSVLNVKWQWKQLCLLVMMIWLELCTTYGSSCCHHFHHPWLQ